MGCHLMTYCDKDCQKEHWKKVHRFHCKILSGEKTVAGTEHRKEDCEMCQVENRTKSKLLHDPNSPATMCHLEMLTNSLSVLLPMQFGYHANKKEITCSCRNKQDLNR